MPEVPEIRYARSGDVHIAYQAWGSGPRLIGVPPFVQNVEELWEDVSGRYPRFLRKLGSFAAVAHFDKRGTGLSDRIARPAGIEERIDDIRAVMDALGWEQATVGGISEGGPMAMLFAATHPERVERLLLMSTAARFSAATDYPDAAPAEAIDALAEALASNWGTPDSVFTPIWMPSMVEDAPFRRWVQRYERSCASPGAVRDLMQFVRDIDVRSVLSSIQAPTLILHRSGDLVAPIALAHYLVEQIPNARLVELSGVDHPPWIGDMQPVVDEIEEFVTGQRSGERDVDRVLATVLFTDIVSSTETASRLGDREWIELLDRHDRLIRRELHAHGGRESQWTGDGFLATFDSPSRAVRCAAAIRDEARTLGIEVRAGLHTGEVERRGEEIRGIAVHIGARVGALAGPSEVLVSTTVRDLVLGSGFTFDDRGAHQLKGVDGDWTVLSLRRGAAT